MARGRQRRKARQRDRVATEMEKMAGPGEEHLEQARDQLERQAITADDVSMSEEDREAFDRGLDEMGDEEMQAAIEGREWTAPEHSLLPGIRMFTAMLDEARGGYIIDRLSECEDGLQLEFNPLEREGIIQVASAAIDPEGIPDVEFAVNLALEARAEVEALGPPGEQVEREHPAGVEEPEPALEPPAPATEPDEEEDEIEDGEEEDPDAPGEDEIAEPMGA